MTAAAWTPAGVAKVARIFGAAAVDEPPVPDGFIRARCGCTSWTIARKDRRKACVACGLPMVAA